ncbi:hypothetical protein BSZ28_07705 [Pseudomonas moraviensis]|nr:hypothetical protein BSZ28_07705 [Pseudomonas moraviensis]
MGASLLAKRPTHSPSALNDRPPSRAGSLPQGALCWVRCLGYAATPSTAAMATHRSGAPLPCRF